MYDIQRLMKNLEKNNMKAYYAGSREEVLPLVDSLIRDGATVTVGGSKTLDECGILSHLKSGKYNYLDRYAEGLSRDDINDIFRKASFADTYICSTNAVTMNGELYNVDGNSNRVSAIVHGPEQVIIICGINKIVEDVEQAVVRVKTVAAPLNAKRLNCKTYCAANGMCVSMKDEKLKYQMGAGCSSDARICCNYVLSAQQRKKDRIKVILVGESLGF